VTKITTPITSIYW